MGTTDLQSINPENCVLFLGSGFSASAKNIAGGSLPTGKELKKHFADKSGLNPDDYDLPTLADEVASDNRNNLYQILYGLFTVKELSPEQISLLSHPWMRIYTTNYDDSVELYRQERRKPIDSYCYDQAKPRKFPFSSVVHLHGAIRQTTDGNVRDQLVLNESSYVKQHFEKSPWYDEFVRDVRFSDNLFFVGYNLSDYHISALLMKEAGLKEKTYFISRGADRVFCNRVSEYGKVLSIGLNGFANLCETLPKPDKPIDPLSLKSLRHIDPFKDKQTLSPPTPVEVLHLLTYGSFNERRCMSSLPKSAYVAPRLDLVGAAYEEFRKSKTTLIHSKLGNGKSIFLYILANHLTAKGYSCFVCKEISPKLRQDAAALKKVAKPVILFDSYNLAIDAIDVVSSELPDAKFVIAVRTGVQDVRLHEIQQRLPPPIGRVSLNGLKQSEQSEIQELLDLAGLSTKTMRSDLERCSDFRDFVSLLFNSEAIQERIRKDLAPIIGDQHLRKTLIAINLMSWIGQIASSGFLRAVTGRDCYADAAKYRDTASEMILFGTDEELRAHSPVFAEYLIDRIFNAEDIIDSAYSLILESLRRAERSLQPVYGKLLQVSNLHRLTSSSSDGDVLLERLFERLHRDEYVKREPLFWLQYSILMLERGDLLAAERFISTAYIRAKDRPGFKTYQIDTHCLRLLLIIEQNQSSDDGPVNKIDEILEKLEVVVSMIGEESHRDFAFKVLGQVEPFLQRRVNVLPSSEKEVILIQLNRASSSISATKSLMGKDFNVGDLGRSLDRAKALLSGGG